MAAGSRQKSPLAIVSALAAIAALLAAFLLGNPSSTAPSPLTLGKNNTILYFVNSNHGYSNVHLATAFAIAENHPHIKQHFGTFPKMQSKIRRVQDAARYNVPSSPDIDFHLIQGVDYLETLNQRGIMTEDNMISPPGLAGSATFSDNFRWIFAPWLDDDHLAIYLRCKQLIEELDPAIVVLDPMFKPAVEAAQDANRLYLTISPNTVEVFVIDQPHLKMLWKFPTIMTGFDYPMPLSKIPENIMAFAYLTYNVVAVPGARRSRAYLQEHGIKNPLDFYRIHRPDAPWISQALPGASMPLDYLPPNVSTVGPIVLSVAPVEEQDAEMATWVKRAPTVLINLGSHFKYSEERSMAMAAAIKKVLDNTDVQVIWKLVKIGTYGDEYRKPLEDAIASGRLKIEPWLSVDPAALLQTGNVVLSVHHGGSNCYHETLSEGVPHVILPLWADLYDFATYAQYYGIGVWGCKAIAPDWETDCLADAFLTVLDGGEKSKEMYAKAKALAEKTREKPGRDEAARMVAEYAGRGHA